MGGKQNPSVQSQLVHTLSSAFVQTHKSNRHRRTCVRRLKRQPLKTASLSSLHPIRTGNNGVVEDGDVTIEKGTANGVLSQPLKCLAVDIEVFNAVVDLGRHMNARQTRLQLEATDIDPREMFSRQLVDRVRRIRSQYFQSH